MTSNQGSGYFRRRGWKDLIFIALVLLLGLLARRWMNRFDAGLDLTDRQKWERRPKLGSRETQVSTAKGETGLPPCFFLVLLNQPAQPVASGSVGDCLLLVPDGNQWNLLEVNLRTGAFVPVNTDISVTDSMPLAFTRTYRPLDSWSSRTQIYLMDVYDPFLFGERNPYSSVEWDLPDVQIIRYKRISTGTGFADAMFEHSEPTPIFGGSRVAWNGWGWDVSLADGLTYITPEAYRANRPLQSSLVAIFDGSGNEIRLTREANGNLTGIQSPSGKWIRITYAKNRISRVENSTGDKVDYEYDALNRLTRTRSPDGPTFEYLYDSSNRIRHVADMKAGMILQVLYDSQGRVSSEILPDGATYSFRYVADERETITEVDVIGVRSQVTRVLVHGDNYTVEQAP